MIYNNFYFNNDNDLTLVQTALTILDVKINIK